jgi:NTE family protein
MPLAIALSGGGARGDFEVGALRALYNRGLRPDIVCGTSVGAINGAAIAQGDGGLEQLEAVWRGLQQNSDMYLFDPQLVTALPPRVRESRRPGLIESNTAEQSPESGPSLSPPDYGRRGWRLSSRVSRVTCLRG